MPAKPTAAPASARRCRRVLAIVTDPVAGLGSIGELRRDLGPDGLEVRVVVPAVEEDVFQHAISGDVDGSVRRAEAILEETLRALRARGLNASGAVGDSDPVLAAEDALRDRPADEVLIFQRAAGQARWFEDGLLERAQESLAPPLRMVVLESEPGADGPGRVVDVEAAGPGTSEHEEPEFVTPYAPGVSRADFAALAAGVFGTMAVIVLAAAVAAKPGADTGWAAVAIGVATYTGLVNLGHVVGITLFESTGYRRGFARFFRLLSLTGTPVAIVVNLAILVLQ